MDTGEVLAVWKNFLIFDYLKLRGLFSLKKGGEGGESVVFLLLDGKFIFPNFSEAEMFYTHAYLISHLPFIISYLDNYGHLKNISFR